MSYVVLLLVLSGVVYRVGRFIALDDLIAEPREWVFRKLLTQRDPESGLNVYYSDRHPLHEVMVPMWRRKLAKLIGCPFCVTAYISAGACVLHRVFVGPFPVPVWTWLAVWTGALVLWAIIDSD